MAVAGEVNQEIGRAYQHVFIGALEASIRGFEKKFDVHREPEKTSFTARSGKAYSFDFSGFYNEPWHSSEVLGECKGYSRGTELLREYRSFLAKAYVTSADHSRHRSDRFWFVTNVPFACSEGSGVRNVEFIGNTLRDQNKPEVREILGESHVDDRFIFSLAQRVGVFILTDSFLMNTELSYKVEFGESLWTILKKFHGGNAPAGFGSIAQKIAFRNLLPSPDRLPSGKRIRLSWQGIRSASGGGLGGF